MAIAGTGGAGAAGDSAGRVDTALVRRRMVSYRCLGCLTNDLETLETAQRDGRVRRLGNRDPGPIFGHLAASIRGSFDGMPQLKRAAPVWLRLVGPLVKKRALGRALRPGLRMSTRAEEALWDDEMSFEEGLSRLREQVNRLEMTDAGPTAAHPVFGRLTPDEWRTFHLRHAELHMSFIGVEERGRAV